MADVPQLEDGYTRLANELFEAILGYGFTGRQLLVLLAVVRKTYGYGKKQDDMSAAQLGQLCKLPRPHVSEVLGQLLRANVITKTPGAFGMIVGINKLHKTWIAPEDCKKLQTNSVPQEVKSKDNHYTYKLTHRVTGEFYIGVRSCLCHPNQDRYMGSGNWLATVKAADLSKEILGTYASREIAEMHESSFIKSACGDPLLRNTRLYASTECEHVDASTGVQNMYLSSTESVHLDRTDSVHTKENLSKENQKKSARAGMTCSAWLANCTEQGIKPIPEDDPIFDYAESVGLSVDFIRLAWVEFRRKFTSDEKGKRKKYVRWTQHFGNAVRENWYGLWFERDGQWTLTTRGKQIETELRKKAA